MVYTDPSGEWILQSLIALGFSYLSGAHENRDRETGKWQWNPTKWYTPIEFGVSTNSSGSNFSAMASVGGQPVLSSEAMANSGNGNNGAVSGINDARGAEFYSRLTPAGALRDLTVFPSLRANYQMHGVDVDMRTGSLMFDDSSIGYDYMWNKSFYNENGRFGPAREVSGWAIKGGKTIVMPYYKNTPKESHNRYQKIRGNGAGLEVQFNGVYYPVKTHVHSHPLYNEGDIGLSGTHIPGDQRADYKLFRDTGLPYIHVLYNNKVHRVSYPYYKWEIEEVWSW